jgi:hypothetical protein
MHAAVYKTTLCEGTSSYCEFATHKCDKYTPERVAVGDGRLATDSASPLLMQLGAPASCWVFRLWRMDRVIRGIRGHIDRDLVLGALAAIRSVPLVRLAFFRRLLACDASWTILGDKVRSAKEWKATMNQFAVMFGDRFTGVTA